MSYCYDIIISSLYPLLLVVVTYIGIELHDRNFSPVIILWKPFHKSFAFSRRFLDPKASVIAVFATFISLSFNKIIFVTFTTLSLQYIKTYHNGNLFTYDTYSPPRNPYGINNINGSLQYIHTKSLLWYIPLMISLALVYLPPVLLLLYPIKFFRKILSYCGPKI